jgi:hypothetical protein
MRHKLDHPSRFTPAQLADEAFHLASHPQTLQLLTRDQLHACILNLDAREGVADAAENCRAEKRRRKVQEQTPVELPADISDPFEEDPNEEWAETAAAIVIEPDPAGIAALDEPFTGNEAKPQPALLSAVPSAVKQIAFDL